MPLVRDLGEITREFEAHALARAGRARRFAIEPLEKIVDRYAEDMGDLEEPAGRDAVDAALVFVRLLIGDADQISKLLLGEAEHDPPLAHSRADMMVDILSAPAYLPRRPAREIHRPRLLRAGSASPDLIANCHVTSPHVGCPN